MVKVSCSVFVRSVASLTMESRLSRTSATRILDDHSFIKIFVEIDPSEPVFAGFRGRNATEDTYKDFCIDLLLGIRMKQNNLHRPVAQWESLNTAVRIRTVKQSQHALVKHHASLRREGTLFAPDV